MHKTLNVLITADGTSITTHRSVIYSSNYLNIVVSYATNSDIILNGIQAVYQNQKEQVEFTLDNHEQKIPSDNLKKYYQDHIDSLRLLSKEYPGNDDYAKFLSYQIASVSMVLSLFGLLTQDESDVILHPLNLVFPNINIDLNILNSKMYYFLRYYIDTLKNMGSDNIADSEVITPLLNHIEIYFTQMKDYYILEENPYEDMMCIHASNLGYGKYLEFRIQKAVESQHKYTQEISQLVINKQNEFKKHYDEEILSIAEQTATIKNINTELIHDTAEFISRSKDEINLFLQNMKDTFETDLRKSLGTFIEEKNKDLDQKYALVYRRHTTALSDSVVNLENGQTAKIKNTLEGLLTKKTGVLKELQDQKSEALAHINETRSASKNELIKLKESIIEEMKSVGDLGKYKDLRTEIDSNLEKVKVITAELSDRLEEFKQDGVKNYMTEVWPKIEIELKKQSTLIIQSTFKNTLDKLGTAIDDQINKRIEARFKSLKK